MSLRKSLTHAFWRSGLWMVGLISASQSTVVQQAAAQSPVDARVQRQSGGWQPTVKTPDVQTAYFQSQGNISGGMPVLPSAGQGALSGAESWNAGQLPAFPGGRGPAPAMPRGSSPAVSPPASIADSMAPPQLPMANRAPEFPYPANGQGGDDFYHSQPNYSNQASQGFASQGSSSAAPPPSRSNGVPARLASTELRTIQNERDSQSGASGTNASGLGANGPQPGGPGLPYTTRPATESFVSGLPYVTPAPRGRYATSPYQPAVFQSSELRPSQIPAQFASSTAVVPPANAAAQGLRQTAPAANLIATQATMPNYVGAAPPAYLTAQQAALPQYRYPHPGVYPTAYQCTPAAPSFPSTGAVPGGYIPPTLPPNLTPNLYTPNNAGYRPLFSLGQENYNVQLGRGIIGQPTAYVPGQHIRNFMRYLSP